MIKIDKNLKISEKNIEKQNKILETKSKNEKNKKINRQKKKKKSKSKSNLFATITQNKIKIEQRLQYLYMKNYNTL